MKKNYFSKLLLPVIPVFLLFACREHQKTPSSSATAVHSSEMKYTCPMHPEIVRDRPGKCPICAMDLVPISNSNELHPDSTLANLLKPVNEQVISNVATITPDSGTRIFSVPVQGIITYDTREQERISSRVAGRIERMQIKYNFQPVKKGQLIMEVYSPDLAAAQRELIYITRTNSDTALVQKAKQKLSLLGMQSQLINQVIATGKPVYKVPVYSPVSGYITEKEPGAGNTAAGVVTAVSSVAEMGGMGADASTTNTAIIQQSIATTPVLIREGQYVSAGETIFTVYKDNNLVAEFSFIPALAATLQKEQKLVFHTLADPTVVKTGPIGLIESKLKNNIGFTTARVYLGATDLKPGQLLTATIPLVTSRTYWLPQDAVLQLGRKTVVFKKEKNVFVPKPVQTGLKINGLIEIKDVISNWQVAINAGFLVDNESFIRLTSNNAK